MDIYKDQNKPAAQDAGADPPPCGLPMDNLALEMEEDREDKRRALSAPRQGWMA